MSTHNICLYKEVDIKYTGCYLKIMEFLDCALIGVCAVIRSNTVFNLYVLPCIWINGAFLWLHGRVELIQKYLLI